MNKRHRTFIAINLPPDVKKYLMGFQKKWADVPAKWTAQDNLHVTLVFLGDLTDIELGETCIAIKKVVEEYSSFDLTLQKIAYGPEGKIPPRYIWVGGSESPEASQLKRDLEDAVQDVLPFSLDQKPFNLHITLARISAFEWRAIEPEERTEVNESIELPFTVESIEVMESELTRQGPRYNVIESYELR